MIIPITSRRLARPRNLLDQHPGAIHATALDIPLWSVSANNPCLLLRRDDDNAVAQFTPAQVRDQQPLLDFVGSGNQGFIEATYDQSLTGRHWTQTTTASQPRLVNSDGTLNLLGGRAAGLYNGSTQYMTGIGFEGIAEQLRVNGGFTLVGAVSITSRSNGFPSFFGNARGTAATNVRSQGIGANENNSFFWRHENTSTTNVGTTSIAGIVGGLNSYAATVLPAQVRTVLNGGSATVNNFTAFDFTNTTPWRLMVGTANDGNVDLGRILGGRVIATLLFGRPLSDAELQNITGTLSTPVT